MLTRWRAPAGPSRRTRIALRIAVTLAVVWSGIAFAMPAAHASYLSCPQPPGSRQHQRCTVQVGTPPNPGDDGGNGGIVGGGSAVCHPRVPDTTACWVDGLGWYSDREQCWFLLMDPQPGRGDPVWGGHPNGAIYIATCNCNDAVCNVVPRLLPPVERWLPTPPEGFGGADYPLNAAAEAINALDIFGPAIRSAPSNVRAGGLGLVGLPVWLWTPRTATTWGPATATASIPGVSATAVARAQQIAWDMGDGHTVVCANPGTAYDPSSGAEPSPNCGYKYLKSSTGRPGGVYRITATTTWRIDWTATNGAHGWVTVTTQSRTTIEIDELQVVIQATP